MSEYDVIIKNTQIVDGSRKAPYRGSIGIKNGKIAVIGEVSGDAKKIIEATGLISSPGWIDAHSHGDGSILFYPDAPNYIRQGVTTIIGGQCGGSQAPVGEYGGLPGLARDYIQELEPHKYYPKKSSFPMETVNRIMQEKFGWTVNWNTMGDWFKVVEEKGMSINIAPLVGHGTIRKVVLGEEYKRHSTKEEIEKMKEHLHQAMGEGCIGLSSGLDYDPGVYASMDEVNDIVKVLKEYPNSTYCPHWRRTGRRRDVKFGDTRSNKVDGILESINTCRITGVPTHLAHMTPGWRLVPEGNDMMEEMSIRATLKFIDDAREEGLELTFDSMPWFLFGGFSVMPYLCGLLTPWLREQGSREKLAKWLKIPDYRKEVQDAISSGKWFIRLAYNPNTNPQWAENIWVVKHKSPNCDMKTVACIAKERNKDKMETYFDLICEDPDSRGVTTGTAETGNFPWKPYRALFFKHPQGALSLDQSVTDHTRQSPNPPYGMPGLNSFSAFPGFINKMVKDIKIFTIEDAIYKMSTSAAEQHHLKGKGKILPGYDADITIFDLEGLKVMGNAIEPRRYPAGIKHVFVHGQQVVENEEHTGLRPGQFVLRSS